MTSHEPATWLVGWRKLAFDVRLFGRVFYRAAVRWGPAGAASRLGRYLADPRSLPRGGGNRYLLHRGRVVAVPAVPPLDGAGFVDHLIGDLAALEAGEPAPLTLAMICITPRCPFRCPYCYGARDRADEDLLPLDLVVRTVRGLAEGGVRNVFLSGGEPMLRRAELPALLSACAGGDLGLWLVSTGHGMDRGGMEALAAAGLRGVMISLDGMDREVHDRVKGASGAFDQACAAVGVCRAAGLVVGLNTVVGPALLARADLERFLAWAGDLGAHFVSLNSPHPVAGDDSLQPLPVEDLLRLDRWARATRRGRAWHDRPLAFSPDAWEALRGCVGGQEFVYVSPRGELMACPFLRDAVGDVRHEPVVELLRRVRGQRAGCRVCRSLAGRR